MEVETLIDFENIPFKTVGKEDYRTGRQDDIRYIVIHYTANNGDTAKNNADYFGRVSVGASAHYFVDEQTIWQTVKDEDTAWHCGGGRQGWDTGSAKFYKVCTNSNSIGIEMCSDVVAGKMSLTLPTITNTVALTKYLMKKYDLPIENVVRHWDVTGKACPLPMVGQNNKIWLDFLGKVEDKSMNVTQFKELWLEMREELKDNDASDWSNEARAWAVETGLIQGGNAGNLMWEDVLTREQFITVLYRFAQQYGL